MPTKPIVKTRRRTDWTDEFYLQSFHFAKMGMSNTQIAKQLKATPTQFKRWTEEKPALAAALKEGRKSDIKLQEEFIYNRLSGPSRKVWNQICKLETVKNGARKVEILMAKQGEGIKKLCFLHALIKAHLNPSTACTRVGVAYSTFKRWVEQDAEFAACISEVQEHKGNFYESKLHQLIEEGDSQATIFANKTFNRKRGYGEKVEHEHSGTITSQHTLELSEQLMDLLSKSARRELMTAMDQIQKEQDKIIDVSQKLIGRSA